MHLFLSKITKRVLSELSLSAIDDVFTTKNQEMYRESIALEAKFAIFFKLP